MKHDGTDGVGVAYVEYIVRSQLRWIFREQSVDDKGVDAHIEICANRRALGRLIGLQIKAGDTYFKRRTGGGWVFRDNLEHLEYFLQHSLPIVVVLCDLEEEAAYWQVVTVENIEKQAKGWTLHVPKENVLSGNSRDQLRTIAQPTARARQALHALRAAVEAENQERRGRNELEYKGLPDEFTSFLLKSLVNASQSVYFVMPHVSVEILWLLKAISTKVRVQGIVGAIDDRTRLAELKLDNSQAPNLELRVSRGVHAKLVVIDGVLAISGSGNLTRSGLHNPSEVFIASCEDQAVQDMLRAFWQIWIST